MVDRALFAERLRKALTDAGYDPRPGVLHKQFSTRWRGRPISYQAARAWLLGSIPEDDKLEVLANWLGLTPESLRYGRRPAPGVREPAGSWSAQLTPGDRETIEIFLTLSPLERRQFGDMIRTFAAKAVPPKS